MAAARSSPCPWRPTAARHNGSSGKKVVTLPAPDGNTGNANGNTGINGGKIVHPAGEQSAARPARSGTKTGPDVKTSMPVNRVTTLPTTRPQLNNGPVMKLNNNPSLGNKFNQGNSQPAKMSFSRQQRRQQWRQPHGHGRRPDAPRLLIAPARQPSTKTGQSSDALPRSMFGDDLRPRALRTNRRRHCRRRER